MENKNENQELYANNMIKGYIITYNPLFKEYKAIHPEGGYEYFKTEEEAINHARNG